MASTLVTGIIVWAVRLISELGEVSAMFCA